MIDPSLCVIASYLMSEGPGGTIIGDRKGDGEPGIAPGGSGVDGSPPRDGLEAADIAPGTAAGIVPGEMFEPR